MDSANIERMLLGADNQLALPLSCGALLAAFVGCGRTPLDPGAQDAAVGGTGGGGAGSSGENNAGGSISGVTIFSPCSSGHYVTYALTPSFAFLDPDSEPCSSTTYGQCIVYRCSNRLSELARKDAGTITLESSTSRVRVVTSPGADGLYGETENSLGFLVAGETLAVSASGGEVAAFDTTIEYPSLLAVDQPPAPNAGEAVVVSRSSPVQLAWTGGAPDVILHSFGFITRRARKRSLRTWAAAAELQLQ